MTQITTKQTCKCENCGNEAEMSITCTLPETAAESTGAASSSTPKKPLKLKGTAVCSHCGGEADMWIDYDQP